MLRGRSVIDRNVLISARLTFFMSFYVTASEFSRDNLIIGGGDFPLAMQA